MSTLIRPREVYFEGEYSKNIGTLVKLFEFKGLLYGVVVVDEWRRCVPFRKIKGDLSDIPIRKIVMEDFL